MSAPRSELFLSLVGLARIKNKYSKPTLLLQPMGIENEEDQQEAEWSDRRVITVPHRPLAAAMDIGVGASLNASEEGTGSGVSLPMRFGNIMVEPALSISDHTTDYSDPLGPSYSATFKNYTLETGIYWRKEVIPSVETYLGGRVGYIKREFSQTSPGSPFSSDDSGYYIGPTFGAEYFFNKHFSIGLDVSLLYSSLSGDGYSSGQPQSTSTKDTYTQARTLLRFYF